MQPMCDPALFSIVQGSISGETVKLRAFGQVLSGVELHRDALPDIQGRWPCPRVLHLVRCFPPIQAR